MQDAWQAEGISPALRAASAASLLASALVATTTTLPGPDPHRLSYLSALAVIVAVAATGHASAPTVTAALTQKISPGFYRSLVGVFSVVAALAVMTISAPFSGSPGRSLVLAMLSAAAIQAFACSKAGDFFANGILGAGAVLITLLGRNPGVAAAPVGLIWAASFAVQLMLAHRHELAFKIAHPPEMGPERAGISQEPLSRAILGALVALLLLALVALIVPPVRSILQAVGTDRSTTPRPSASPGTGRTTPAPNKTGEGSGSQRDRTGPRPTATPGSGQSRSGSSPTSGTPGQDQTTGDPGNDGGSGSESSEERGALLRPSEYPLTGIDLARMEPEGDPKVFAVMKAKEPRLMRANVFTVYSGNAFLASDSGGTRIRDCPCTLPVSRDSSAPFDEYDQLIEVIAQYDGPLPAAFEARRVQFRSDPGTSIHFFEGGTLVPSGAPRVGFSYRVESEIPAQDRVPVSSLDGPVPEEVAAQGLQLPEGYSERVRRLAESITRGKKSPYEKATAIIEYVVHKHRFASRIEDRDPSKDAVEEYLFGRGARGIENDAVVAAVVMMRTVGVPARVAFGYRPTPIGPPTPDSGPSGSPSPSAPGYPNGVVAGSSASPSVQPGATGDGAVYYLDRADRTTWIEVYISGFGWVTQDIEPLLGRPTPDTGRSSLARAIALALALAITAAVTAFVMWRRAKRKKAAAGDAEASDLMRLLERAVGIARQPSQTPSEYGAVLWARLPNAQRELAMGVVTAIVQLSYTKTPLSETQRARVYRELAQLAAIRRERERSRRHARRRARRGA